ncbi:prevent-host-death protein [Treponema sp. TIM-1]|uniref:prevent-host-death protein n=1 Tax=Treponema sp. TIM-1 TaxID=2898417 RepID=UPI00397E9541
MLVFDYTDFIEDATEIFNAALTNEVIVNTRDGNRYKILPIKNEDKTGKSPLEDIPCIEADITTQEIVELLRESRAGI